MSRYGAFQFSAVMAGLLQAYMLRETNVKDICVTLAKDNQIEMTWGRGARKPKDGDLIRLKTP